MKKLIISGVAFSNGKGGGLFIFSSRNYIVLEFLDFKVLKFYLKFPILFYKKIQ